jgi:geranylgeranyl diphosphate synthase type I
METPIILSKYRQAIADEMRSQLEPCISPLYAMLRYHLGWEDAHGNRIETPSGKALRPALCLMACEALSGGFERALPAAAAVELLHNFSLIHDDVQDDDRERRGRPTVWALWGKPQAINAGTAMRILAGMSIQRMAERGANPELVLRLQCLLDETTLLLLEGQYLDIYFESCQRVGLDEYLRMIERKTVALIACSLELGGMIASDDPCVLATLRRCGEQLGFAFQVQDDLLGIWGDERLTGKPVGADIRRKKKSFPIVLAWEQAGEADRQELASIYSQPEVSESDLGRVMEILDHAGSRRRGRTLVQGYSAQAVVDFESLGPPAWAHAAFRELVTFLTERDH